MSFLNSIEFYVILVIVAAAIVAIAARPHNAGAVKELLLGGTLVPFTAADEGDLPQVAISCTDSGRVIIVRRGLGDITMSGAVSIVMKIKGFDISIEERLTPGSAYDDPAGSAMFTIDTLAPAEYYHIRYNSSSISRSATFTFHTRPGITATHFLNQ